MMCGRLAGIAREIGWATHLTVRSRPRYVADVLCYRLLRVVRLPRTNAPRTIVLRDGPVLTYRMNRGDIQAIREIWAGETYRPPVGDPALPVVVDLGANIGFTSVYFAWRHGARTVVAVEPDPDNARILRRNLAQNGVEAVVLEAAVGPTDGEARFSRTVDSNLGKVGETGMKVQMLSMESVLRALGDRRVDMLKIDIEGGEGPLLLGQDLPWMEQVDAVMIELHGDLIGDEKILDAVRLRGFDYIPAGSVRVGSADTFVRQPGRGSSAS